MRQKLVVANWKMNGSAQFAESFAADFDAASLSGGSMRAVVCPPSPYLRLSVHLFADSVVEVGAQDVSAHSDGAFTGEMSAEMLTDAGATWAIVGHSERRAYHGETDALVVDKAEAAMSMGLTPICCVGETLEDREADSTQEIVGQQVNALVEAFGSNGTLKNLVVAYEPVWAIGTGKTATPDQAQEVHAFIRSLLGEAADNVSVLYGGSVKPSNAKDLFDQPDIDGGLVGGASLVPQDFLQICQAAN